MIIEEGMVKVLVKIVQYEGSMLKEFNSAVLHTLPVIEDVTFHNYTSLL